MHELGITRSIVEIAENAARAKGAQRVVTVTVEIGTLSGVIPEAVEFCFEACSAGTLLEGSRLAVVAVPGRGRCDACGTEAAIDQYTLACPACGAFGLVRLAGEELRVTEVEID